MFCFKRKIINTDILHGMCDVHTHILPMVDDGVQTEEESLAILDYYESLGISKVIFTPHIMEDLPQDIDDLRQRFEALSSAYCGNVELSLAAEYMLDYSFFSLLEKDNLLTLWDNYLLVEMSYAQGLVDIVKSVQRIMTKGYFVVLAHPERYLYLSQREYKQLKDIGVRFQLNLTALFGAYGDSVRDNAIWLLESSYYDFIGTDIHKLKYHTKVLSEAKLSKKHIKFLHAVNHNSNLLLSRT